MAKNRKQAARSDEVATQEYEYEGKFRNRRHAVAGGLSKARKAGGKSPRAMD